MSHRGSHIRPAPEIPDHEVLRKIGGGSYGEVYMARGVTGAMRAVKVVWREDFEDERTFEREFDGILKYEPVSRDHPALVSLLHIGRSSEEEQGAFYYYVMELGDDCVTARDFNPVEYEARTLLTDLKEGEGKPLDVRECITAGKSLAGALAHLHECGLAHRDVKPANIIFVDGKAMLADIGLVAAAGGRSFVGTEGFVPPEGPGSAQADLYSLGKVLYEMASGKDRLDFPELPDELPAGRDRKLWLSLNKVICDICEPRLSMRKIKEASALEEALTRLEQNKPERKKVSTIIGVISALVVMLALVTPGGRQLFRKAGSLGWGLLQEQMEEDEVFQDGVIVIQSQPENASIYDERGEFIGYTKYGPETYPAGDTVFELRYDGHRSQKVSTFISPGDKTTVLNVALEIEAPPEEGQPWSDTVGMRYGPMEDTHVSYEFVTERARQKYQEMTQRDLKGEVLEVSEKGEKRKIILTTEKEAYEYTKTLRIYCLDRALLTEDFIIEPVIDHNFTHPKMSEKAKKRKLRPFKCKAYKFEYASVELQTDPPGAGIMFDGEMSDQFTSEIREELLPGLYEVQFILDGYRSEAVTFRLKSGERKEVTAVLKNNKSVIFGKKWKNGLGMEMLPVGDDLMVSRWETRLGDFETYIRESDAANILEPDFEQKQNHPVVNVTLQQAKDFCEWLTQRERKTQLLAVTQEYRLPTDLEWSRMVGLEENPGLSPAGRELDDDAVGVYVWGKYWVTEVEPGSPPANLADQTLASEESVSVQSTIIGYQDGYPFTAPVDSFSANAYGLKNLAGNVHEWVNDTYDEGSPYYVLRGGGWNTHSQRGLYTRARNLAPPDTASSYYGFRIVLARVPAKEVPASP